VADRAEATGPVAARQRMEGYGGPVPQRRAGLARVGCNRCKTRASLPLNAVRRRRSTPICELQASLKCQSCMKDRFASPIRMVMPTEKWGSGLTSRYIRLRSVSRRTIIPVQIAAGPCSRSNSARLTARRLGVTTN